MSQSARRLATFEDIAALGEAAFHEALAEEPWRRLRRYPSTDEHNTPSAATSEAG